RSLAHRPLATAGICIMPIHARWCSMTRMLTPHTANRACGPSALGPVRLRLIDRTDFRALIGLSQRGRGTVSVPLACPLPELVVRQPLGCPRNGSVRDVQRPVPFVRLMQAKAALPIQVRNAAGAVRLKRGADDSHFG